MFGFIKEMFIRLLSFAGLQVNVCDSTKCVSLDNQPCQVWPCPQRCVTNKVWKNTCKKI